MGKTLKIEAVDELNRLVQAHTYHTLVCVLDNPTFLLPEGYSYIKTGLYIVLMLKTGDDCTSQGHKNCDFRELSMTFHAPGEKIEIEKEPSLVKVIAFHPDLFFESKSEVRELGYSFFNYKDTEALYISIHEKHILWNLLDSICDELHYGIDIYSRKLLSKHVSLLLDYCRRFYQRQFYLRSNYNKELLCRFDKWLDEYISSSLSEKNKLPSYNAMAKMLGLSLSYFTDMMRIESGKTLGRYVQGHLIDMAKRRILNKNEYLEDIVAELGFPNIQSFNRLLKKMTGYTPTEYRINVN